MNDPSPDPSSDDHCALPAQAVLRCDIVLLLAPVGLQLVMERQVSLRDGVATGLAAAVASAAASLAVDSVFWRRWIWPELHVLLFNTVQNRCRAPAS